MSEITLANLTGQNDSHIQWLSPQLGLHPQAYSAFQDMVNDAAKVGINITIASGFRNFDRQLSIWQRKVKGQLPCKDINNQLIDLTELNDWQKMQAILTYSALPGTSRHHWGTDIDVYDRQQLTQEQKLQLEPWEYQSNGPFYQLAQWLIGNSQKYGFYLPYDQYRGGIASEPWHISYYPVAEKLQQQLTPNNYLQAISDTLLPLQACIHEHVNEIFQRFVNNIGQVNE